MHGESARLVFPNQLPAGWLASCCASAPAHPAQLRCIALITCRLLCIIALCRYCTAQYTTCCCAERDAAWRVDVAESQSHSTIIFQVVFLLCLSVWMDGWTGGSLATCFQVWRMPLALLGDASGAYLTLVNFYPLGCRECPMSGGVQTLGR